MRKFLNLSWYFYWTLLVPAFAFADVHPLRIVTQTCGERGCRLATAYGSAVSIGRLGGAEEIFLTAAHCVAGQVHRIEVGIRLKWFPARILARSENHADLALLRVSYQGGPVQASRIAEAAPDSGTIVTLTGFPQGRSYRRRSGNVMASRYVGFDLLVDQPSQPGESGGGIFNPRGELVGITAATGPADAPTETLATGIERIHRLLRQVFPAFPQCKPSPSPKPPAYEPSPEIAELQQELARLQERLAALEAKASKPPPCDPAILKRLERLEQIEIPVQILTPDGQLLDEARYRLGEPLQFRLMPKRE